MSVPLLQGGEKCPARFVLQYVDAHEAEVENDDRDQERPSRPPFVASPIALGQNPDVADEPSQPGHPALPTGMAFLR